MSKERCIYNYAHKCDCSEDDRCGCTYPNNMPHDFTCNQPIANNTKTTQVPRFRKSGSKTARSHIEHILLFVSLFITTIVLTACFRRSEPDLCQIYNGLLPAASSVGIDTTITFFPDEKFTETDIYVGEKNGTFNSKGTYKRRGNKLILTAESGEQNFYLLEKGKIRRLDINGQPIVGNLADFYILKCQKTF